MVDYLEKGQIDWVEDITGGFDFDWFDIERATIEEDDKTNEYESDNVEDSEDDENIKGV